MKMKKTQSLKLMLLGLMALGSTSVQAKVGDVFPSKGLVCVEKEGNTAVVVGVSNENKTIIIPSQVVNPFEGGQEGKTLTVNELHKNWYVKQLWTYSGAVYQTVTTPDVRTFGPITLQIEASALKSIDALALNQVTNIENFYVMAGAGLEKIEAYSFHANQTLDDPVQIAANETAKANAIAAAQDALSKTAPAVKDGKFQGKLVYKLLGDEEEEDPTLVILGDAVEGEEDAWGEQLYKVLAILEDGTTKEIPGLLLREHKPQQDFLMNDGEDKPIAHKADRFTGDAYPVETGAEADVANAEAAVESAQEAYDEAYKLMIEAENDRLNTDQTVAKYAAKAAKAQRLWDAIYAFSDEIDEETGEPKQVKFAQLQRKVSQHTGTNVSLVTPWYIAYVLANDPEFLGDLTETRGWEDLDDKTEEFIAAYTDLYKKSPTTIGNKTIDAFNFTTYWAAGDPFHAGATASPENLQITELYAGLCEERSSFDNYDEEAAAQGYYQVKVVKYNGSTEAGEVVSHYYYIKLAADEETGETTIDPDTYYVLYEKKVDETTGEVSFVAIGEYTVEVTTTKQDVFAEFTKDNPTSDASENVGGVAKAWYMDGENQVTLFELPALASFVDNSVTFTIAGGDFVGTYKFDPRTNRNKLQRKNDSDRFIAYKYDLVKKDYTYTQVLTAKINPEPVPYTIKTTIPSVTVIDDAYPGRELEKWIAQGTPDQDMLDEIAREAVADEQAAGKELAAAKRALAAAKKALKAAQKALADAEAMDTSAKKIYYYYTENGEEKAYVNGNLKRVKWNNEKIKSFGEACFEACPNAAFKNETLTDGDTQFPAVTKNIDAKAFKDTHIDARLDHTNSTITSIGHEAFRNTETTTVALKDATGLANNSSIGNDVWDNTPMVTINLLNTGLTEMPEGLAEDIRRGADAEFCDKKFTGLANTTLTTVVMPKGTTKVREENFFLCLNLSSVTPIPTGITEIGDYAFAGTSLTALDLTGLTKLTKVGDGAFAYNSLMKSVKFADEAPFENLEGDAFKCDLSLEEIDLNDSIKCLAAGLFADTKIKKLDLSNSQVEVLPDLFWGSVEKAKDANSVCNSLKTILLPETQMNATNDKALIPGLKVIGNHAFAFLQGITTMTIPSSVWAMGTEVFAYCGKLKTVTAMDSRLTNLGAHTFRGCTSLNKFTFVTLSRINPDWTFIGDPRHSEVSMYGCEAVAIGGPFEFDDYQFDLCNENNGTVKVIVTEESAKLLEGQYYASYNGITHYSDLVAYKPTLTLTKEGTDDDGNTVYSDAYYNSDYGTWIPIDQATVYTAYQDMKKVYLFKAKHNDGYYKIPAVNWTGEKVTSTAPYWLAKGAVQENFLQWADSDAPITDIAQGSAAVIIMTSKADGTFKYERHSAPGEKYQSTLDRDNELKIAGKALVPNLTSRVCVWAKQEGNPTFYRLDQESQVIPKGKVVFPSSTLQGAAMTSRLEVVIVNDEVTSIKDFVKAMNDSSDAIYNLQGVRVSTPQKGQLYIQGGKKFIQK